MTRCVCHSLWNAESTLSTFSLDAAIQTAPIDHAATVFVADLVSDDILREVQPKERRVLNEQHRVDLAAYKADFKRINGARICREVPLRGIGELWTNNRSDIAQHRVNIIV